MKYILIFFILLTSSCQNKSYISVTSEEYGNFKKCYQSSKNSFEEILLLVEETNSTTYVGVYSTRCFILSDAGDDITLTDFGHGIHIRDFNKVEYKINSTKNILPLTYRNPDSDRGIFSIHLLKAKIVKSKHNINSYNKYAYIEGKEIYDIEKIQLLKRINMKFDDFAMLSPEKKIEIYESLD
jgi:hypothetical protein